MSKLTQGERLARLQKNHNRSAYLAKDDYKELDGTLSIQITQVERELGFPIMGDYPLMKFLQQKTDLEYLIKKENEQSK